MVITGIDQFTLVLQDVRGSGFDDWINWEAEDIRKEFMKSQRC